jgi:hypothetical protein
MRSLRFRQCRLRLLAALCVGVSLSTFAWSDDPAPPPQAGASPIGVRQQRVARMMQDLERRLLALARTLEESEPERAARLVKAFEESKNLLVEQRMQQITKLLDDAKLDNASQEQKQVLDDVRTLLAILLAEGADKEQLKEEIERLKQWHQQISMLIKDEQQQQAESAKLDKKDEALDKLAKQIQAVEELLRREQDLVRQTALTRAQGIAGLDKLADRQETIRKDTEFVAKEIAGSQGGAQPGQQSATAQPANAAQPANGQFPPGQRPLEQSAAHQKDAEQNLQAGQGKTAQQDEEQAVAELKKALDELRKEQERLQKPPEDTFDKLAQQQEATANKTSSLSDQVAKAAQANAGKPGAGACSACQQCLGGACQSMQSASQSLQKKSPGSASSAQKKAAEELQQAQKEIEKRLQELGENMQDETIERLEDIFRTMLARQQQATAQTAQLDIELKAEQAAAKEAGKDEELGRADRITLRRLVQEEQELSGMAAHALQLIEEDGTSVSFPVVVANMRDNLDQIAALLEKSETGDYTQTLQREVEKTLEELIEALQIARRSGGGGGGGGGGNCKPALLPNTAELKLLRALQLHVNRRTVAFDEARPEGALDQAQKGEITRISTLQKEIGGMVHAIIERTQPPPGLEVPGFAPLLQP